MAVAIHREEMAGDRRLAAARKSRDGRPGYAGWRISRRTLRLSTSENISKKNGEQRLTGLQRTASHAKPACQR